MLDDRNNDTLNQRGAVKKMINLLRHDYAYVLMKLVARIYFLKRAFIFFSRLTPIDNLDTVGIPISPVELTNDATVTDIVSDLQQNGCSTKIKLNDASLNNILIFAINTRCYAYGDPKLGFYLSEKKDCEEKVGKDILIAKYLNFQDEDVFSDFISASNLEGIARKYLGNGAKNIATQLWWTFPADVDVLTRSKAAHFFHRDVDAWGFVKFFFYITDVGEGGGPHVYVKKSHKVSILGQIFKEKLRINRHSDASIRHRFGNDSVFRFFGKAGMGMAADTFGFHKGDSPEKHPRLMLCAVYATEDYGIQQYQVEPQELATYYDLNQFEEA